MVDREVEGAKEWREDAVVVSYKEVGNEAPFGNRFDHFRRREDAEDPQRFPRHDDACCSISTE